MSFLVLAILWLLPVSPSGPTSCSFSASCVQRKCGHQRSVTHLLQCLRRQDGLQAKVILSPLICQGGGVLFSHSHRKINDTEYLKREGSWGWRPIPEWLRSASFTYITRMFYPSTSHTNTLWQQLKHFFSPSDSSLFFRLASLQKNIIAECKNKNKNKTKAYPASSENRHPGN